MHLYSRENGIFPTEVQTLKRSLSQEKIAEQERVPPNRTDNSWYERKGRRDDPRLELDLMCHVSVRSRNIRS